MKEPDTARGLAELPRDIPPAHDLWPSILAQIAPPAATAKPLRRPLASWLPWAVTAGLAVVVSGTWWMHRNTSEDQDLLAALGALPIDARLGAKQSLDAVRNAREQIADELKRNGDDPALRQWLADTQQQEILVRQAIVDAGARSRAL